MADYGIKVSVAGTNVQAATADQLILSSSRNCLKVNNVQTTSLIVSGFVGTTTISHGLSFAPVVIAFMKFPGGATVMLPYCSVHGAPFPNFNVTSDTTNVVFNCLDGSDGTYTVYYFLSETESAS